MAGAVVGSPSSHGAAKELSAIIRFAGYLGAVLFVGGIALANVLAAAPLGSPTLGRLAIAVAFVGYAMMLLQAVRLVLVGSSRLESGVLLILLFSIGLVFAGYLGPSITLSRPLSA